AAADTMTVETAGGAVVSTRAVVADPQTVQTAAGRRVRAAYILIATGGAPTFGDPIPGIEHAVSSNEAFYLQKLPQHVLIQGGGYIALEFAGIFAGLGARVTIIYRGENILRGFDDDVRSQVRMHMERHGIKVITGCKVMAIEEMGTRFSVRFSKGFDQTADCVMFATGGAPNVARLGLEDAGVETAKTGHIFVDEYMRTRVPSIYAIGDVTNRINLTPVAIREGAAVSETLFGARPIKVDHTNIPTAVFSDPEVGVVGLTEAQARARFARTDIYRAMFQPPEGT